MRASRLFGEALKDAPADAEIPSHQLLVRAGYIRQLSSGIFSYLPLAQRSLKKIETILREEMDAIGGQELNMPVVHPAEPWRQSGRWDSIDVTLVRFQDRGGRDMLLAMTHEEIVSTLARSELRSYKQLPQLIYQLQTKFRDEARPRGGLIRVREFIMKDSYSLDLDDAGLDRQYVAHYGAYFRMFARAGLPVIAVRSDVGMMGGKLAHEFMYVTPIGEDSLIICKSCSYAANREVARFDKGPPSAEPARPVEKIATPEARTIEALCRQLGISASQTAKVVFFTGDFGGGKQRLVMALVRGDMEANPIAVQNLSGASALRTAHETEIRAAGCEPGYASPIGIKRPEAVVVVDDWVARSTNLVCGANEAGFHLLNVCCGRDYEADVVGPIAAAHDGAKCKVCGQTLGLQRGVEVGNIFKLGTRYSAAMGAKYLDEQGKEHPVVMGSYGIGVGRLLACVAEHHRDDRGLALPISVAPFQVCLVSLANEEATAATAERIYGELQRAGVEVLYDDRKVSAGVKLSSADLRGMPLRLLVSDRSLKNGQVELKRRIATEGKMLPAGDAAQAVLQEIEALKDELAAQVKGAQVWSEEREKMLAASET